MWKASKAESNSSELIITPGSILCFIFPSSFEPDLEMLVLTRETGRYFRYPIQDFDQNHPMEIYDDNHKASRFILGNDCGILLNRKNELHIFQQDGRINLRMIRLMMTFLIRMILLTHWNLQWTLMRVISNRSGIDSDAFVVRD